MIIQPGVNQPGLNQPWTNQPRPFQLRRSEWLILAFFLYTAALVPFFSDRPHLKWRPLIFLGVALAASGAFAAGERYVSQRAFCMARDWTPIALTLLAFQEMDLFRPAHFNHLLEAVWMAQDMRLLSEWRVSHAIEKLGLLIPFYLETCYLLVYGVAAFCVGLLYKTGKRALIDDFYLIYLGATLGAYACFPFFPSEAPRLIYPDLLSPGVVTWMRTLNLSLLRAATIHVSVFPSAHVSSAFSAAWAILLLVRRKPIYGWLLLVYAISVAVATIYGRYHYSADAIAGLAMSLAAVLIYLAFARPRSDA